MHILSQHRYKDAPRHTRTHAPVAPIHALDPCNEWPKCLAPWDGWNGMRWGGMGGCCCEYSRRREMHTSASNPAAQARSIHCCNSITLGTRPLPSNITALVGAGKGNEVLVTVLAERLQCRCDPTCTQTAARESSKPSGCFDSRTTTSRRGFLSVSSGCMRESSIGTLLCPPFFSTIRQ